MAMYIMAAAAVIGAGYSIYKGENQPDAPQMPAPQKPARRHSA